MKIKLTLIKRAALLVLLSTLNPQLSTLFAQGTAFTYQGRLNDGPNPAGGIYDLRFAMYDAVTNGAAVSGSLTNAPVAVSNGLFTVTLDFGPGIFTGATRWLEIGVRTNGGVADYFTLSPRQAMTPSPYAILASGLSGTLMSNSLSGAYGNAVTFNNAANNFNGAFSGTGTGLTNVNALTLGGLSSSNFWRTSGNAGTTPGLNFLGTTDNQPLELKVNGTRALRLEPTVNDSTHSNIVNVVGGSSVNFAGAGVYGATIGGGGALNYLGSAYTNRVEANFGTVSGGGWNTIQTNAKFATIGGGGQNMIQTSADYATIGGGVQNTIQPIALYTTIGGGGGNTIQTNASQATIGGGALNTIQAGAEYATIGGGGNNTIQTNASRTTIGGGYFNTIQNNAYIATIGGGWNNMIQSNAWYATIGGGVQNMIQTDDAHATIGGGALNTIQAGAEYATIGGGRQNTILANATNATIPGGYSNSAASYAFAAGYRAKANHSGAFVWADSQEADFASTGGNQFCIRASGGVRLNGDTPIHFGSTLSQKLNLYGTTFGLGIQSNIQYSRVGASAGFAWYAGGVHNDATYNSGGGTTLMKLDGTGLTVNGAFVSSSDRNAKENFAPVQPSEVLAKVVALPLSSWNYKADTATRHVGPMAQDFYAAFNVGPDDKHIATVDADGVALAAIQGLNQKVEETRAENAELKARLEKLERLMNHKNGGAK